MSYEPPELEQLVAAVEVFDEPAMRAAMTRLRQRIEAASDGRQQAIYDCAPLFETILRIADLAPPEEDLSDVRAMCRARLREIDEQR
jgi:hypothetical protein